MKNIALLMVLVLALSSCSLFNDDKKDITQTPVIEAEVGINEELETEVTNMDEIQENEETQWEYQNIQTITDSQQGWYSHASGSMEKENISVENEVSVDLDSDIESEEALNEVFNEIEELFELAEQNGGQ